MLWHRRPAPQRLSDLLWLQPVCKLAACHATASAAPAWPLSHFCFLNFPKSPFDALCSLPSFALPMDFAAGLVAPGLPCRVSAAMSIDVRTEMAVGITDMTGHLQLVSQTQHWLNTGEAMSLASSIMRRVAGCTRMMLVQESMDHTLRGMASSSPQSFGLLF